MFSQAVTKFVFVVFTAILVPGTCAFASEKKEEKKEVKKEELKEGEQSPTSEGTESQKKQQNEATELQTRVQALQAKIKTKEETIAKLIEEKNHSKDPAQIKEIIQQMVVEHKEMAKMIEEYEQSRSLLRYRYPEKGYKGVRAYERLEAKPLTQMENQMSVEAKLKRNIKTMQSQFGSANNKEVKKRKSSGREETQAPSLTEPIVIKK